MWRPCAQAPREGGSSICKVKIPYNNSFLTTRGHPALRLDRHKKPTKIRYCKLVSLFLLMLHCLANVVILGLSFVRRLKCDLNAAFNSRTNTNFELSQSASIHLHGVVGRTVEKLKKFDLSVIETFKPNILLLEIGTNCLSRLNRRRLGCRLRISSFLFDITSELV